MKKTLLIGVLLLFVGVCAFFFLKDQKQKKVFDLAEELANDFNTIREQAYLVYQSKDKNGKVWWNEQKPWIVKKYGKEALPNAQWKHPEPLDGFDPNDTSKDFVGSDATPFHFLNQIKRIPLQQEPSAQRILQIALNVGQGMAAGSVNKAYVFSDFISLK